MDIAQFELNAEIEERHWWFVVRRRIMRTLVRAALPPGPESRVMDVGCGTGGNAFALAEDYPTIGVDLSPEAVELAGRRTSSARFVCGRVPEDLTGEVEATRLFLIMDVLEHVPDDFALLTSLLAAAQPGAKFLMTVPADPALWSGHDESHGHYRRYVIDRFRRLWRDLPVETHVVSYFNARLYPLIRFIRARNRRRGVTFGRADTDLAMPSAPVNRALQSIFAGERKVLLDCLEGRRREGYAAGASLIALVERREGEMVAHGRPDDVAPDTQGPIPSAERSDPCPA